MAVESGTVRIVGLCTSISPLQSKRTVGGFGVMDWLALDGMALITKVKARMLKSASFRDRWTAKGGGKKSCMSSADATHSALW